MLVAKNPSVMCGYSQWLSHDDRRPRKRRVLERSRRKGRVLQLTAITSMTVCQLLLKLQHWRVVKLVCIVDVQCIKSEYDTWDLSSLLLLYRIFPGKTCHSYLYAHCYDSEVICGCQVKMISRYHRSSLHYTVDNVHLFLTDFSCDCFVREREI